MRNLSLNFEPHRRHCVVNAFSGMATRDGVQRVTKVEVIGYSEVVWRATQSQSRQRQDVRAADVLPASEPHGLSKHYTVL